MCVATKNEVPDEVEVGGRVRLLKSIFDDGEDHHPPCWLASAGEVLVVREVRQSSLAVSHEDVVDSSFTVYAGEFVVESRG